MRPRGRLIAIEGIDGAGKSTQVRMLADAIRARRHTVVVTREPTDGPHGRRIRQLSSAGARLTPEQELAHFLDDRHEHVRDVIAPALARGDVVVTDRYFISNVAYQGARGLDPEEVLATNEARFPLPDAVVLLALDVDAALARVHARGEVLNRSYERADFLRRVVSIFDSIDRPYMRRIDASRPEDVVHAAVIDALGPLIERD